MPAGNRNRQFLDYDAIMGDGHRVHVTVDAPPGLDKRTIEHALQVGLVLLDAPQPSQWSRFFTAMVIAMAGTALIFALFDVFGHFAGHR